MRGYFGIGVEGLSKPMNAGNLFRSAQAFGASFLFTIAAAYPQRGALSDTSRSARSIPLYEYPDAERLALPGGCRLVGIEFRDDAEVLPSFRHPVQAAYVLGPERGALSPALATRCDHLVKIPTAFCVNVATAGAIVMYDRLLTLGRFAERPVSSLAAPIAPPPHVRGGQKTRTKK